MKKKERARIARITLANRNHTLDHTLMRMAHTKTKTKVLSPEQAEILPISAKSTTSKIHSGMTFLES